VRDLAKSLIKDFAKRKVEVDLCYSAEELGVSNLQSLRTAIYQVCNEDEITRFFELKIRSKLLLVKINGTPPALASTSESGLLNEVVTSEHDKEIIVALKILVNKGIIKAVRLIGISKAEFEILYPDVVKHVSLTDIDEGVIMI